MTDIDSQTTSGESTPPTDGGQSVAAHGAGLTLTGSAASIVGAIDSSAFASTTCHCKDAWIPCDECIKVFNDGFK
jgi:hypothetical protein